MAWSARLTALACAALVGGCDARDAAAPSDTGDDSAVRPRLPVAEVPLAREDLLLAVLRVASAAAVGEESVQTQRELDGKLFELRLRFGCPNAAAGIAETRNWTLDDDSGVVRIEIGPEIEIDTPPVEEIVGPGFEAAEGFWIRRPWLLRAACLRPAERPSPAEETPGARPNSSPSPAVAEPEASKEPAARVGIAQFFTTTDARTHRRDRRPYKAAEGLGARETPSLAGYDLIISGRLLGLSDGRVIACRPGGDQPPSCIISARFEQVSLERADTGESIAEWPSG